MVFQVVATHPYAGEDVDELSFEPADIINVIAFDEPEDQVRQLCYYFNQTCRLAET